MCRLPNWGLEPKPRVVSMVCPLCGEKAISRNDDDFVYACGTEYEDGHQVKQTEKCQQHSHTTTRRAATICGILNACEKAELIGVLDRVLAHVNQWDPAMLRTILQGMMP